jgi:hypothetical protein
MNVSGANEPALGWARRLAALALGLALVFTAFFFINKGGSLGEASPFAEDPFDLVGSFAFPLTLLAGLLSFGRSLRLEEDPSRSDRASLILRGGWLVVAAASTTLAADGAAMIVRPTQASAWQRALVVEWLFMILLTLASAIVLAAGSSRLPKVPPPRDLSPADAIDDLWALVRVPVAYAGALLPQELVMRVQRFHSDALFSRVPWLDPRLHPWRFTAAAGLVVGAAVYVAQLREGLPSEWGIALEMGTLFIGGELVATILGFAMLGGYLGLRPASRRK